MKPVGGLKVGNKAGVNAGIISVGSGSKTRTDPVLFTLTYYGYHDPESKNLHLVASVYGFGRLARLQTVGGRHVALGSAFVPGYFGGNTNSFASWFERGAFISITAQGITKVQLARFVAGLKEHPAPKVS